ncbi:HU family DNA-binding protein [Rickettsiales bacterium LUAb2]
MSKKNIIKKDIENHLYNKIGFPKKELNVIINDIFELISYSLENKQKVKISSFGTFDTKHKKERVVFNPKTKEPNKILARNVVNFQASKKFRQFLMEK